MGAMPSPSVIYVEGSSGRPPLISSSAIRHNKQVSRIVLAAYYIVLICALLVPPGILHGESSDFASCIMHCG
jgi:hypothetical protein